MCINKKKIAFRNGDTQSLESLEREMKQLIGKCKNEYKQRVEDKLTSGESRVAWDGLKTMMGTKKSKTAINTENDAQFAEELNTFYSVGLTLAMSRITVISACSPQ